MQDTSSKTATSYYGSSSFKMALLFTILLGLSTAILSYFIYSFNQQGFIRETEAAIDADIAGIVEWTMLDESHDIDAILRHRQDTRRDQFYLLLNASGKKRAGNIDAMPKHADLLSEGIIMFDVGAQRVAAKIHTFDDGARLLVARDISDFLGEYEKIQLLSGLVILFMFIVIFVSFAISGFVVSRINRIASTAQSIMDTGDLSQRLPIDSTWDDLSNLARVLNRFLDRIEELLFGIRTVADNIAHDLRTPLTRLRNRLEKLDHGDSENLVAEADHLLDTFNALLRISNIETGKRHSAFETVALRTVMQDVVDLYEPLAEEKNVTLDVSLAPQDMTGDRDLLFQAFANLLDNAVKFTPDGGNISIALRDGPEIVIADTGPGIPEHDRKRVFERFYRGEASRTTQGSGLGLSLVAAVVELHRGRIALEDNAPGLKIRIGFKH